MQKRKKLVVIVIVVVVLAACIAVGAVVHYRASQEKAHTGEQKRNTVRVVKTDLTKSISATGTLASVKSKKVTANVNSIIVKKVLVNVGDSVKKGDALVEFEKEDLQEALQNAKEDQTSAISEADREVSAAQKQLTNAKKAYAAEANNQNQTAVDNAESALETAQWNRTKSKREAQRQVDEAQKNLDRCKVTAPMDGLVTVINVEKGTSYSGGSLMQIEDTSAYTVTTTVDEYDISNVKVGQKVVILTEATDEEELEGNITFVAPSTGTASDTESSNSGATSEGAGSSTSSSGYEVKIKVTSKDDRLKLGMTARCSIVLEEADDVLAVPYDAVHKTGDKSVVYVLEEGTAEQKEIAVTVGMESDYYVEVQGDSLQEGMQVVIPSDETETSGEEETQEKQEQKGFGGGQGFGAPNSLDGQHRGGKGGSGGAPGGAPAGAQGN